MSLAYYEAKFGELNPNRRKGATSPHKIAMLLAVMALIEKGELQENRIYFDATLTEAFTRQFDKLKTSTDRNNPHWPYLHLRSSGIWHHHPKPGQRENCAKMALSGPGAIHKHIAFVTLDDELFELLQSSFVRELLKAALEKNFTIDASSRKSILREGDGWDWLEREAVVQDYFAMLNKELRSEPYTKAAHRRLLQSKLDNRSEGAIEFKHQNISAVLVELGLPYILGYKPAFNYQKSLKTTILAHLAGNQTEIDILNQSAEAEPNSNTNIIDWGSVLDHDIPEKVRAAAEQARPYLACKPNYAAKEANNRRLGEQGEEFALQFEQYRLTKLGRPDLAKKVEWTSREQGDGLGFDILSFDPVENKELYVEVKTTSSGKYQPFYISDRELTFSQEMAASYKLYRVYEWRMKPRLFILSGAVDDYVSLRARSYEARFS
ncbi:DUF3883 domain-containing protein [Hahella sp. KA22]|nr:DUF3883 domain-containing protein [Hahella sp. KA22]QAY52946.1 DUF3883 domain-containing protein [Hahella sp. KA22]